VFSFRLGPVVVLALDIQLPLVRLVAAVADIASGGLIYLNWEQLKRSPLVLVACPEQAPIKAAIKVGTRASLLLRAVLLQSMEGLEESKRETAAAAAGSCRRPPVSLPDCQIF
jgi:hypothetical protein